MIGALALAFALWLLVLAPAAALGFGRAIRLADEREPRLRGEPATDGRWAA